MEIQEGRKSGPGRKKKAETTTKKKVRFKRARKTISKPEEMGGSLRTTRQRTVMVDRKKAAFTKALYQDYTPDAPSVYDNEVGMYSHFGGKISGKGAAFDPPDVRRFLHHTFKKYPKLLAAYHAGKVVNPPMPKPKYY